MSLDIGRIISTVAPWIATALGGPLAGTAVKAVTTALGLDSNADEDTVKQAIASATPEQLLALKKADEEYALKMQELGYKQITDLESLRIESEKVAAADRDSARERQKTLKDATVPVLAFIIVASFIATVAATLLGFSKAETVLSGTLIGYLSAKAEQVVAYYFGSSSGSKAKDETLSAIAKTSVQK